PEDAVEAMGLLEKFLHNDPVRTPPLIKAALVHAQFETIHPFLDGNGRVGRLLITLILCAEKLLSEPMLYLSLYFKTNRQRYYDLLQAVRTDGDWESWLLFFLEGVRETASAAVATAKTLTNLFAADQQLIETLGRSAGSALRLHGVLQRHPVISIARAAEELKLSIPTVTACMERLIVLEIVRELTGKGKNRRFGYSRYIQILAEGTEPL
ncbi:MAG: Fic family protein, partial [bacterium]